MNLLIEKLGESTVTLIVVAGLAAIIGILVATQGGPILDAFTTIISKALALA